MFKLPTLSKCFKFGGAKWIAVVPLPELCRVLRTAVGGHEI